MANYPDLPGVGVAVPAKESKNVEIMITDGGTVRGQRFNSQNLYEITITHHLLSVADVTILQTFFTNNRNTVITTRECNDGETYNCKVLQEPIVEDVNGTLRKVTQKLHGTRV